MPDLTFVPYEELGDTPNIVVDGAANPATVLTLSHWPRSGTPRALKADSSAEIVFNYLDSPEFHVDAKALSNNHFDEDGLIGLFTLIEPEIAMGMRDLLVDAAHAGDFTTYRYRRAARIAFTISAFTNPATSPLDPGIFDLGYAENCAALYGELLPRIGEIAGNVERFRQFWDAEDYALHESERAINNGSVTIREVPHVGLAVVSLPETAKYCHPMAINNATSCNRVLSMQGRRYSFLYRYESWVQYMTSSIPPRVDLTPLAEELTADEPGDAIWTFDGVSEIVPTLTMRGEPMSGISPEVLEARLIEFLESAPAAWDPYDPS